MRNISAWAIRNPVIPLVLFTFLLAMGLLAFMRMDVNLEPDISFPAAIVSISQPGAAPPELEIQITRRVEAAVRGINGVDRDQLDDPRGQQRDLRRCSRSARRSTAPSPTCATPSRGFAATFPTASSSRRSSASRIDDEPIVYHVGREHRDDASSS